MKRMHKKFIYFIFSWACLFFINISIASDLSVAWELEGFNNPESALYDAQHDVVFLSNVEGAPDGKDGAGYISVLSLSGEVKHKYWVAGLNAPKGLGRDNHYLYVADIDRLIKININNGKIEHTYHAAKAKFLNDVIVDDNGDVYVSDMVANIIYRLSNGKFSIWLESDVLENPNGLYIEDNQLIVGAWGKCDRGKPCVFN